LDLVQPTYRTTHDGALAVLSVLSNFVSIWLTVSKILKIQFFLTFGSKLPSHAHFLGFMGFDTLNNFFLIETFKRHILGWSRVVWSTDRENPSTRFCCRRRLEKKEREGKERKRITQFRVIFQLYGERTNLDWFLRKLAGLNGPTT